MESFEDFGVYAVIIKEDCVLLILKKRGPFTGSWDLPGGGIEEGEEVEETLVRELKEEVAIQPLEFSKLTKLEYRGEWVQGKKKIVFCHYGVIFKVDRWVDLDSVKEEEEKWIPLKQLDQVALSPFAKQAINLS